MSLGFAIQLFCIPLDARSRGVFNALMLGAIVGTFISVRLATLSVWPFRGARHKLAARCLVADLMGIRTLGMRKDLTSADVTNGFRRLISRAVDAQDSVQLIGTQVTRGWQAVWVDHSIPLKWAASPVPPIAFAAYAYVSRIGGCSLKPE